MNGYGKEIPQAILFFPNLLLIFVSLFWEKKAFNSLIEVTMDSISYKTTFVSRESAQRDWIVVDAQDMVLGRFASEVAKIIRGKHKPTYTPHVECGDNVIIINASKIRLTGKKWTDKEYISHTGYPGGQRFSTPERLKEKGYNRILESAVRGMLPKNRIGRSLFRNLFIYDGAEHPHAAQAPKTVVLK